MSVCSYRNLSDWHDIGLRVARAIGGELEEWDEEYLVIRTTDGIVVTIEGKNVYFTVPEEHGLDFLDVSASEALSIIEEKVEELRLLYDRISSIERQVKRVMGECQ